MIVLYQGHSLTVKDRFQAEAISLQLSERQSTATVTVASDMPDVGIGDWMQIESGPGSGIVWRVKSVDEQYDKKTRTIQLEHTIQALKDRLMFGDVTTKMMGGSDSSCTARQAVAYVLSWQSDWLLGDCEFNVSNPYAFNGDDLLSALETISGSLDGCIWDYNFGAYPFVLHLRKRKDEVATEMRMDRNIRTLKKTIDRSQMYTRIYPIGKDNLHITGNYLSKNESLYGIVCKTETDQSQDTEGKLKLWAQERLDRHCEPYVTVTISGIDLAKATGESLDAFYIGWNCQVPLPEFSTTIIERVTKLNYPDIIKDPENVTITLANEAPDLATIIKQQNASGGKGGRASAKNGEEKHAWIVDTADHVGMVAEAVAGPGADKDWSRVSEVIVDGQGIHQRVTKTEGDMIVAQAAIEVNEEAITAEVKRATGEEGKLTVRADAVEARVSTAEGNIGTLTVRADVIEGRVETAEGNIGTLTVRADGIDARVSTAEGNIGTLQITANSLTGRVSTAEGKIGQLEITANSLTGSVSDLVDENTRIEGKLVVTAGSAGLTASLTDAREVLAYTNSGKFPATGDANHLYYDKTDGIYYEWKNNRYVVCAGPGATIAAGDICVAINESGESEATINASKIYLLGQTIANTITADYINSKIADMASVVISNLSVTSDLKVSTGQYEQSVKGAVWDLNLVNNQNGTYTLQRKRFNDSAWVDVGTFSRATTPTLSGSWSGGTLTVTSNPAPASTFKRALSAGAKEKQDGTAYDGGKTFYIPIQSYETGVTPPTYESTGYRVYVDATLTYNSGYTDGFGSGRADGMHEYYTSGNWAAATAANDWYAMIPTETNSGSEPWDCGARSAYSAGFTRGQATTPDSFQVKTSDITGSSVGSVSGAVSGAYICFKVGEYKYYLKLD